MNEYDDIKLCCQQLTNFFNEKGKRGRSILLYSKPPRRYFVEQYNATDFDAFMEFNKSNQRLPFSCTLREQGAISYCPHCGTNLRKWILDHPKESDLIEQLSKQYIM
jgi:hypothetical protein